MDNQTTEPISWRDLISILAVMGVVLGIEQALPIPGKLRMQVGVLIALLTLDFWSVFRGLILPGKNNKEVIE